MENSNNSKRNLYLVVGILFIGAAVYAYLHLEKKISTDKPTSFTSENVNVNTIDVASVQGQSKLPVGFPINTPIELENITDSTTLVYPDRKVTLSNVSYFSHKQQEELFALYGNYLKANGYTINITNKAAARMIYNAQKGNTEMGVIITPQPDRMVVLVSYIVREQ